MVKHTTQEDQDALIKWIVVAFASNSSTAGIIAVDQSKLPQVQLDMGNYMNRILLKDCLLEAREAARYEGEQAVVDAFAFVSKIAGREAMNDPGAAAMLEKYIAHVDVEQLDREVFGR